MEENEIRNIFQLFYDARDEEKALQMSAYMKNKFSFLGLQKPVRAKLSKDFLKGHKKDSEIDWKFIFRCFEKAEREFHYLAIDYLLLLQKKLRPDDVEHIEKLILTNSWWDSVDGLDELVGQLCLDYPELKDKVIYAWIDSDNVWLKRVTINFQLKLKEKTDTEILARAIKRNSDTGEFFVNKAIGWALREYSKTDKKWVSDFLLENELDKLSVKEASKYL